MKHVFVSSTFKDMQFERDDLHRFVAPSLDGLLMPYGEEVYFGDLRWGVNTTSLDSDEGSRRVLEVCLDEIDDCRPYMIVLIGERYGWIPDASLIRDAAAVKGVEIADEMSVTQLEIEYGALLSKGARGRVFFYFRELDTSGMNEAQLRDYTAESELHRDRINALKERISSLYPDAVRTYTARWDAKTESVVGLESFVKAVKADLSGAFLNDLAEEESLPWQERAIRSAARHYMELTENYHPAERMPISLYDGTFAHERTLMRFIKGASGTGKSAYLAHSYRTACEEGDPDLIIPFVLGLDKYSTCEMDYFKILLYVIEQASGMSSHYETAYGDPTFDKKVFDEIFSIEGLSRGVIHSFIDNCSYDLQNKLSIHVLDLHLRRSDVEYFGRNESSSDHLEFTIAYSADDEAVMLAPWFDYSKTYVLSDVTEEDQIPLIKTLLRRKHKELDDSVISAIAEKEQAHHPFYLKLVVDRMLMLDSADFAAIRSMGDGMDNINRYQISVVESLPDDTVGMARELISRVASRVNRDLVMRVIGLLTYGAIRMDDGDIEGVFSTRGWTYSSLEFSLATRSLSAILNYNPKDKSYAITNPDVVAAAEELLEAEGYSYVARALYDHIVAIGGGVLSDALFRAASYVGTDFLAEFYVKQRANETALSSETDWLLGRRGAEYVAEILTRVATNLPEHDFSFLVRAVPTSCLICDDRDAYETVLQTILDNFVPTPNESDRIRNTLAVSAWCKLVLIRSKVNTSDAKPLFSSFVDRGVRFYPMTPRARVEFDTVYYHFLAHEAYFTMQIITPETTYPDAIELLDGIGSAFDELMLSSHLVGAFAAYLDRAFDMNAVEYRMMAKRGYRMIAKTLREGGDDTITADDIAMMIDVTLDERDNAIRATPESVSEAIEYMVLGQTRVNARLLKNLPRILHAAQYVFDEDENDFNGETVNVIRRVNATARAVAGNSIVLDDLIYAAVMMEQNYDILSDHLTPDEHIALITHLDRFTVIALMRAEGDPRVLYRTYLCLRRLLSIFSIYDMDGSRMNLLARIAGLEFDDPDAPMMPELLIGSLIYAYSNEKNEGLRLHLRELLDTVEEEEAYADYASAYRPELMYVRIDLGSEDEIAEDGNYFSYSDEESEDSDDGWTVKDSISFDDDDDDWVIKDSISFDDDDDDWVVKDSISFDDDESDECADGGEVSADSDDVSVSFDDVVNMIENDDGTVSIEGGEDDERIAEMLALMTELGISIEDLFAEDGEWADDGDEG